jgi:hypothetical protein
MKIHKNGLAKWNVQYMWFRILLISIFFSNSLMAMPQSSSICRFSLIETPPSRADILESLKLIPTKGEIDLERDVVQDLLISTGLFDTPAAFLMTGHYEIKLFLIEQIRSSREDLGSFDPAEIQPEKLNAFRQRYSLSKTQASRVLHTMSRLANDDANLDQASRHLQTILAPQPESFRGEIVKHLRTIKELSAEVKENFKLRNKHFLHIFIAMSWGPIFSLQTGSLPLAGTVLAGGLIGGILFISPWSADRKTTKAEKGIAKALSPTLAQQKAWLKSSPEHSLDIPFERAWNEWSQSMSEDLQDGITMDARYFARRMATTANLIREISQWQLPNGQPYSDYIKT